MQNPFSDPTLYVGRKDEESRVTQKLASGQSTLLIGGRRAGKTSLIQRLNDLGRLVIRFDPSQLTLRSEDEILSALASEIQRNPKAAKSLYATREEFTELLEEHAPIALIIDEADRLLGEPWAGSFLSFLRWLDDSRLRRRLSLLLSGGPLLGSYKNPDDFGSPPLNTADPVFLEPLDDNALQELLNLFPIPPSLAGIRDLVGGHPWMIKKLLAEIWDGVDIDEATERVLDASLANFKVWKRQIGSDGVRLLKALPPTGTSRNEFMRHPWVQDRESFIRLRCACLVHLRDGKVYPGSSLFLSWLRGQGHVDMSWDLAISYASENESVARAIWSQLRPGFRVFFAPEEKAWLWGEQLSMVLPNTYGVSSRFVIVLSTEEYVRKHWTITEFRAALSLKPGRLLVVNCGKLPEGIPPDLIYREADPAAMITLVRDLQERLRNPDF